jgi:hypothetical protein
MVQKKLIETIARNSRGICRVVFETSRADARTIFQSKLKSGCIKILAARAGTMRPVMIANNRHQEHDHRSHL